MNGSAGESPAVVSRVVAGLHIFGLIVIVFMAAASAVGWSDPFRWTADVATIPNARPYDGLLSNMGIIAWAAGAAISLFVGLSWSAGSDRALARLLVWGGVATTVLLLDDQLMIHDTLLPEFFGVPEIVATAAVALAPLVFLWSARRTIPRTSWVVLAVGVAYLAVMAGIDTVEDKVALPGHHLWEEGAKFLGILHWCGYLVLTSWQVVSGVDRMPHRRAVDSAEAPGQLTSE